MGCGVVGYWKWKLTKEIESVRSACELYSEKSGLSPN